MTRNIIRTALPDPLVGTKVHAQDPAPSNTVIYAQTTGKYAYPTHPTPYLLVANQLNPGHYQVNRQAISTCERSFLFLNPGDSLAIDFSNALPRQTWLIQFDQDFVCDLMSASIMYPGKLLDDPGFPADDAGFPSVPFHLDGSIRQQLAAVKAYAGRNSPLPESVLIDLIAAFLLLHQDTARKIGRMGAVRRSTREELYRRLTMARLFMEDNVCRPLPVAEIAKHACLNRFHFLRSFKELYGVTPHQYLLQLKLDTAFRYLKEGKQTVNEVCAAIGFESAGTFSNLFRRRFGFPPSRLLQ